jgi:hypothetical protein
VASVTVAILTGIVESLRNGRNADFDEDADAAAGENNSVTINEFSMVSNSNSASAGATTTAVVEADVEEVEVEAAGDATTRVDFVATIVDINVVVLTATSKLM